MSNALSHLFFERVNMASGASEQYNYADILEKHFTEVQMDSALQRLIGMVNDYVGGLIDVAAMPEQDRIDLKSHLKAAEDILLRNGNVKLQEVISGLAGAVLSRF